MKHFFLLGHLTLPYFKTLNSERARRLKKEREKDRERGFRKLTTTTFILHQVHSWLLYGGMAISQPHAHLFLNFWSNEHGPRPPMLPITR